EVPPRRKNGGCHLQWNAKPRADGDGGSHDHADLAAEWEWKREWPRARAREWQWERERAREWEWQWGCRTDRPGGACGASARTTSRHPHRTEGHCGWAAPVPVGREHVLARREAVPAARHSGHLSRH